MIKKILLMIFCLCLTLPASAQRQDMNVNINNTLSRVDVAMTKLIENLDIIVADVKNIKESLNALKTDFMVMQNDYSTFKKNDWPIISNKVDSYMLKQTMLENEMSNIKVTYLPEIKTRVDSLEKNFSINSNASEKTNVTLNIIVSVLGAIGTVMLAFFLKSRQEKK
jgi:hypothetical protein